MKDNWFALEKEKVLGILKSNPQGLSSSEFNRRQSQYGLNTFEEEKHKSIFSIFTDQFKSPLIYILIFAGALAFYLKENIDGTIIFLIIILNAVIGTIQEGKARNTLEALSKIIKGKTTVLRDGNKIVVLDNDIVPGDIILLKDGDIISADARILTVNNLKVNEASLTGESNSVYKTDEVIKADDVPTGDQNNMVFRGTYVVSGFATAVVVRIGRESKIGRIATQLEHIDSEVPLKKNIENFSKLVIVFVFIISATLFLIGIFRGNDISDLFFIVVAVAVSAIPESLPVVVTIVLATGVWRMSKKNTLVKRLQAVEALGQANVLALDKTGTITRNQMMVEKLYINGQIFNVTGDGYSPQGDICIGNERLNPPSHEDVQLLGRTAVFTSIGSTVYDEENKEWQRISGDPTEVALLVFGEKVGLKKDELEKQFTKIKEIPFDLSSKHHTTFNMVDDRVLLSTAGSPESILKKINSIWKGGKVKSVSKNDLEEINNILQKLSGEGYRVIALAGSFNPPKKMHEDDLPELTFFGFVGIQDVIRENVLESVSMAKKAGMQVIMITGDHKTTAQIIANKVGIYKEGDNILAGNELEDLSDDALRQLLPNTTVFARVNPEHKLRIIKAFKNRGDIIAMTGDGINDALSLVAADLGVSMGKIGTEVAKEASDIILLDDDFGNIIHAAEEGRNIYKTIRKSILYLISTNLGEMFVIVVAVIIGWPLPLIATQILWLNMVTDSFLVAALAVEPKSDDLMRDKFVKPSKWLIDKTLLVRSILIGTVMTVGTLILFKMFLGEGIEKAWTISLTMLTVFQWYNLFNVRSQTESVFKQNIFDNKYLVWGLCGAILIQIFAIYTPFMNKILHITTLNISEWLLILIVGLSVILVDEIRKLISRLYIKTT